MIGIILDSLGGSNLSVDIPPSTDSTSVNELIDSPLWMVGLLERVPTRFDR
jgi:hypothetical protein